MHYFTKTGSGQTKGNHSKKSVAIHQAGDCAGAKAGSNGCSLYYYLVVTIASDDMVKCGARNVAQLLPSGMSYQYDWAYPNSPDGGGARKAPLLRHFMLKNILCQDRLGTNIRKH